MEDILRRLPLLLLPLLCTCGRAPRKSVPPPVAPPVTTAAPAPARELRGVWLASVLNIDYPQNPTPSAATLQADFRSQLYRLRQAGVNTLFVQVRAAGDALYPSAYAPWSRWLTGAEGRAPASRFDPLDFMVGEAHAQGLELHAWVNPYRVAMTLDSTGFAPSHLLGQHPEWIHPYGNRQYLDPGLPQVRDHLGRVIDELVANYDLDGIHFDDYFYPYPIPGVAFPDSNTYRQYGGGRSLADWRRANVNTFVAETHRRIKAAKPWVQFGISPFGVWRNQAVDPAGSPTRAGATSYDDLYGDALAWARAGTVDYLAPQLYWSMEYAPASHRLLADWWSANTPPGVDLYFGLGAYKVGDNADAAWNDPREIPRQIAYDRRTASKGNIFFSATSLYRNPLGLQQQLQSTYPTMALLPEREPETSPLRQAVKLFKPKVTERGVLLVWELDGDVPAARLPHYYAIYRGTETEPAQLLARTAYGTKSCYRLHFYDESVKGKTAYRYRIVGLDRWHREVAVTVGKGQPPVAR